MKIPFLHPAVTLLGSALVCISCASVPKEAVILSQAVSERIAAVQASHESFLHAYFQLSRDRISEFMQYRWIPEFLDDFVRSAGLMEELRHPMVLSEEEETLLKSELVSAVQLDEVEQADMMLLINSALGDRERGAIVLDFASVAFEEIELQKRELMSAVDQRERQALRELRESYALLVQMQATVTAHLQSLHDVSSEQDRVTARLGLLEDRDRLIDEAVALNERVLDITNTSESATQALEQLRSALGIKPAEPIESTEPADPDE